MPGHATPLLLALSALVPACSSGLDFDGLSGDFGKGCTTGVGPKCEDVASSLAGLRVELPCEGDGSTPYLCLSDATAEKTVTLRGTAGTTYRIDIRFRGIVEKKNSYGPGTGGIAPFQIGGTDPGGAYNSYGLVVSDPMQTYFLNASDDVQAHTYSEPVDATGTVFARAMATVRLFGDANDMYTIRNIGPNMVPNPTPDGVQPSASGQFMQVDVVSVAVGSP